MINESTSCIPLFTFIIPTIHDQSAPAAAALKIHNGICIIAGSLNKTPTTVAASTPTTNCPSAPILKTPVLNENATESPVNISGLAYTSVHIIYFGFPNTLSISLPYAADALIPANERNIAPIIKPTTMAISV